MPVIKGDHWIQCRACAFQASEQTEVLLEPRGLDDIGVGTRLNTNLMIEEVERAYTIGRLSPWIQISSESFMVRWQRRSFQTPSSILDESRTDEMPPKGDGVRDKRTPSSVD